MPYFGILKNSLPLTPLCRGTNYESGIIKGSILISSRGCHSGSSQNMKQVPQKFTKAFNVDEIALTSQLMAL